MRMKRAAAAALVVGLTASMGVATAGATSLASAATITEDEVLAAQQAWADGIVEIGQTYLDKGDYRTAASEHIQELYAYEQGGVLFKPTLAREDQFRGTFDEALSYFVGGGLEEDAGFAIKPWQQVRFGERHMVINGQSALAMGNYYFTSADSDVETKVEFTFGYIRDEDGRLRINLHHSSLPFQN